MNIAVRYYTRTGNAAKLAAAIADAVGVKAYDTSVPLDEKADILFLGSSVYAGKVDEALRVFVSENKADIGKIYSFSTAAFVPSAYKQMRRLAEQTGVFISGREFHTRGSFGIMHKGRPNEKDCAKAAAFAKDVVSRAKED